MARNSISNRLKLLRTCRVVLAAVFLVSIIPCVVWLSIARKWLNYDYHRPESEQPFFKDVGLIMALMHYSPLFFLSLLVLVASAAAAVYAHLEIRSTTRWEQMLAGTDSAERENESG